MNNNTTLQMAWRPAPLLGQPKLGPSKGTFRKIFTTYIHSLQFRNTISKNLILLFLNYRKYSPQILTLKMSTALSSVNLEVYFRTSNLACETLCENALPEANMWKACEMYAIRVQACESLFQNWDHCQDLNVSHECELPI